MGAVKGEFAPAENKRIAQDKLTGHLLAEVLKPGDYYRLDDTAVFLRWELLYSFQRGPRPQPNFQDGGSPEYRESRPTEDQPLFCSNVCPRTRGRRFLLFVSVPQG
jgi:hypothetical protein